MSILKIGVLGFALFMGISLILGLLKVILPYEAFKIVIATIIAIFYLLVTSK